MDRKMVLNGALVVAALGLGYVGYKSYIQASTKEQNEELQKQLIDQGKYLSQKNSERRRQMINGNVDYKLTICAVKGSKYTGYIEITLDISSVQHLFLDFQSKNGRINGFEINGSKVSSYLWNNSFIIIPKQELKKGTNKISILFISEYVTDGEGLHSFVDTDSQQYIYSHFEPAYCRKWIPSFDQPDIKCNMTLSVLTSSDWKVISNEIMKDQVHDDLDLHFREFCQNNMIRQIINPQLNIENLGDLRVWNFKRTPVMSTYLLHLSVGPYSEIRAEKTYKSIPMSLYCRQSLYQNLLEQKERFFETTNKCMEFYENFFHYEFPFSKYDHIFCPEYNIGAMENVGAITVNDLYIFKDKVKKGTRANGISLTTHELCHMWFGDLVTMKWWNDTWLKESFADWLSFYSADRLELSFDSFDFMANFNDRKAWGYSTDMSNASHPIAGEVVDTQQARSIFDGITYSKGASVLKQLMFVMGEQQFSDALAIYFNKHQYSNTVLDDFFDAMSQKFDNQKFKLQSWKTDWIEKAGCNTLEPIFDRKNNKFIIKQGNVIEKFSQLRWHRINAAFFKQDGSYQVRKLWVENKQTTEYSDLDFNSFEAVLLNWDDQDFCKVVFDQTSFKFFSEDITLIKGVVNQKIFVRGLFEMIKDAQLTSKSFLEIVQKNINKELNEDIISTVLNYLLNSIHHYTPLKDQDSLYYQGFEMIYRLIQSFDLKQDKDLEVMLIQNLIQMATTSEHILLLVDKLDDQSKTLTNIQISYYNKWDIVEKTFRNHMLIQQGVHQRVLQKLLEQDKSDYAKRRVLTCNTLLLDQQGAKDQLWQKFTDINQTDASHNLYAQMYGFNCGKNKDQLYHEKYFIDLKSNLSSIFLEVYHQLPITYAQHFLENLFPVSDEFEFLLEKIDEVIVELGVNELPTLRKKMVEKKDYVKRRQAICGFYQQQG